MAPKTFTNPRPAHGGLPFTIEYQVNVAPAGEVEVWEDRTAEFVTVAEVAAGALLDFGVFASNHDPNVGGLNIPVAALHQWFQACLPDDQAERFTALMYDKQVALHVDTLGAIAVWLADEFASRPTKPSGSSPDGSGKRGTGQTAPAPSGA